MLCSGTLVFQDMRHITRGRAVGPLTLVAQPIIAFMLCSGLVLTLLALGNRQMPATNWALPEEAIMPLLNICGLGAGCLMMVMAALMRFRPARGSGPTLREMAVSTATKRFSARRRRFVTPTRAHERVVTPLTDQPATS